MSSAVLAPVRSSIVLIATVEPCRKISASAKAVSAFAAPVAIPSIRASGVDSVFPNCNRPVVVLKAAISVKVPPISAASLILGVVSSFGAKSYVPLFDVFSFQDLHWSIGCVDLSV